MDYAKAIEHLKQADQENTYTLYLLAVAESEVGNELRAAELFRKVAHQNEVLVGPPIRRALNRAFVYSFVRSKALAALSE